MEISTLLDWKQSETRDSPSAACPHVTEGTRSGQREAPSPLPILTWPLLLLDPQVNHFSAYTPYRPHHILEHYPPQHASPGRANPDIIPVHPMEPGRGPCLKEPVPLSVMNLEHSKRPASGSYRVESPSKKKHRKWSAEEDAAIINLRSNGIKWEDVSRSLPGRSAISCRLRYQNYLERRSVWDEAKKNKLAGVYARRAHF